MEKGEIAGRHWEEEAEAERWQVAHLPEVRRPDWGLHSKSSLVSFSFHISFICFHHQR